jgi:nitroimidazol reductase NimA-like FMN-containing flavoprotein (pyridoxamine 5'-phosphate oxidase superfamily)
MFAKIDEHEATTLLAEKGVGRLGCVMDGGPYVVPINYYFADGCIYSHSLPGSKISALRVNPRACVQVDEIVDDLQWRSVLAFGNFEEIITPSEKGAVLNKLLERHPMLTPVESTLARDGDSLPVIVYRIRVERITGMAEA